MTMTNIQVKIQKVYGNKTIYPVCDAAKTFAKIANKKTLSIPDLNLIQSLGFKIEVIGEQLENLAA